MPPEDKLWQAAAGLQPQVQVRSVPYRRGTRVGMQWPGLGAAPDILRVRECPLLDQVCSQDSPLDSDTDGNWHARLGQSWTGWAWPQQG